MNTKKHIHFIGIKGVGMTPLAIIAKEAGFIVTGCDVDQEYITDPNLAAVGIIPQKNFSSEHFSNVDLVITTGAHGGYDNSEVRAAKEKGIKILTQGQAVGYFMSGELFDRSDLIGISIAGCHGKTTTTAMIATILRDAKLDPSFVIGTGFVPSLGNSGEYGKGKYFIAEADEYATEPHYDKTPKLLWQHPKYAVITNIEFDHPDLYTDIEAVRNAYKKFIQQLSPESTLIVCGDDENIRKILEGYAGKYITYGFSSNNDYVLQQVFSQKNLIEATFLEKETEQKMTIGVPGEHNGLNGLAAYILAKEIAIPYTSIQESLAHFTGTKRRIEFIGELPSGALVYDDYAHHPTEIQKSLAALRSSYVDKNLVCIFQPHTYSRTKELFDKFYSSFSLAHEVIFSPIYASQREMPDTSISSELLAEATKKHGHPKVTTLKNLSDVVQYVRQQSYDVNNIVVTMGAGDIYTILPDLLKEA